jgi:GTP-binding protein Era
MAETRCGFVALIGAPNAGKSTLLNTLLGTKLAIVTPKVQTTRSRLRGIAIAGDSQLVFIDTPGIFAPRRRLDRAMVAAAWEGVQEADVTVLLVDAERGIDADVERIVTGLKEGRRSAVLALNKIDRVDRRVLLGLAKRLSDTGAFSDVFMISALTGDGVADLKRLLAERMPLGPWLYPADEISDLPARLLAAEITREKLFLRAHQEVPYASTVETEGWEEHQDGSVKIDQIIYVQRPTQKAIVIGKGGAAIKAVREAAQAEIAALLGRNVHLFLFVKVRESWQEDPERYRPWGLKYEA